MDRSSTMAKSISVLDIFGFEVLQTNSFEQLCINYANEKLHQQFVNNYFKAELAEYKAEGVAVDFIQFRDNAACLALIEKKPLGVLALLHEECCLRNCTDASFVAKLNTSLRSTGHFLEQKLNPLQFGVQHYAGDVVYDAVRYAREGNKSASHRGHGRCSATIQDGQFAHETYTL
jgi:myosin heavy subunit